MATSVKSRTSTPRATKVSANGEASVKSKVAKASVKRAAAATKKEVASQERLVVERVPGEAKLWQWTLYVKNRPVGASSDPWKRWDHCAKNAELVTGRKATVVK